ncbi:MAG: branched-chain amino acid ABC transporter substrate-binding protein [Fimbriimonadaceae bacterium]|nr:branched-chain amino acid ABC transporter substrate-binding protein [Alphaproteobacteria bacterium]
MTRVFKWLPALVLGTLISAGATWAEDKGAIKIVAHFPMSGPQSVIGEADWNGTQLALDDFGEEVKQLGFSLELQAEDDQANPTIGVANANRFINDPDILAVVGHQNSGVTIPASEVYAKVGLAMVSPAATNPDVTKRESTRMVASRICGRDDVQGPAAAEFAANELKVKSIYVVNDKTAYGSGLAGAFEIAAKSLGIEVLLSTGVDQNEVDFSSVLNRAAVEKPDLIFYGGVYSQGGLIIKQIRQKKISAVLLGGDGLDSSDLQNIAGEENMVDVYFTTTSVPLAKLPEGEKFANSYRVKFSKEPEGYSAYSYDATRLVISAIATAIRNNSGAKPTRDEVAAEVRKTRFDGLTGHVALNDRGDIEKAKYVVVAAGKNSGENSVVNVLEVAAPQN